MSKLKLAIQKSGRLSEGSLKLLKEVGIKLSNSDRKLKAAAQNFPLEVLFLRDDDIPQYVEQGVADVGIVGENVVWEKEKAVQQLLPLGFAACRMALAVPKDQVYNAVQFFEGKRIATSYPKTLQRFLQSNGVSAEIEELGGSVEIATGIGLADGICDIVSTGSTLLMNGLKEVELVAKSEAVLIANPTLSDVQRSILDKLIFRIQAVKRAAAYKYILLNAPNAAIAAISEILPGMKSPTVLPLANEGWSSLHAVVKENEFWDVIDQLKDLGAEGILVIPIEQMVV